MIKGWRLGGKHVAAVSCWSAPRLGVRRQAVGYVKIVGEVKRALLADTFGFDCLELYAFLVGVPRNRNQNEIN